MDGLSRGIADADDVSSRITGGFPPTSLMRPWLSMRGHNLLHKVGELRPLLRDLVEDALILCRRRAWLGRHGYRWERRRAGRVGHEERCRSAVKEQN